MKKTNFITIQAHDSESSVCGVIKHDFEQQLDCDYFEEFEKYGEGEIPTRYEVTVVVKEIGPLKPVDDDYSCDEWESRN